MGLVLAAPKSGDESHAQSYWLAPVPYLGVQSVRTGRQDEVDVLDEITDTVDDMMHELDEMIQFDTGEEDAEDVDDDEAEQPR